MRSIGILILGLMVGQACAATVNYIPTGVYGVPRKPGLKNGDAPPYGVDERPLIARPGQMVRIGDCKKAIPGSHCEIVFTDIDGCSIRKLNTEKYIPGQLPDQQPHTIRKLIGTGEPGDVDGTANPVIIPGGGKEDSGSDYDCESPHRRHSIDGYVSGEDSDHELAHRSHKSAFKKVVRKHRGSDHGSVHEDSADRPVCADDLLKDDCELGSPDMRRSTSMEHCSRDDSGSDSGSESGSESCRLAMPPAQFNRPLGIASLPSDKGPQFLVSDIENQSLSVVMPFGKANYLAQTLSRGNPENPRFITSDGNKKYFCAAGDCIVEVDTTHEPPRKTIIAGKMEVEDTYDFAAELKDALSKDYAKEVERLLSEDDCGSAYGSDTESDCGEKILVTPLNGAFGIAYTTGGAGEPTIYYTEREGNALGKLEYTSGNWKHSPVAPDAKFIKPTSISVTEKGQIVVDEEGVKLVTGDAVTGYTVKTIIDNTQLPEGALSAELGCNGDIYVGCPSGNCIRRFSPQAPVPPAPVPGGGNVGVLAAAGSDVINKASTSSDEVGEQDFRFGLSSEQIMLTMRQRGVNFTENASSDPYSKALNAVEKAVDSTKAIKQIGKGMTFWVSGLYTQGQLDSMFGNPAMKNKHYAVMAGTHYKDAATQQIFGVAVNVGFGNSISKVDKDMRVDNKAAQITLYYNKKFDEHWKFSWHNTFMRSMDRHQRPFTDDAGNKQIAIGNGVTYEFASIAEVSYKHEFCRDNFIKPFTAISYTYNKDMAWKEKNVGRDNLSYSNANMDQIGLQFGIKSSFGKKISDTMTFVVMPRISYTNFAKMGKATQISTNEVSGVTSTGNSGTPGRHLISATLGIGVVDYESNTTTRFAYTGNVQKQKRSHEFLLDWGMKF